MTRMVTGHFTSGEQADMATRELLEQGFAAGSLSRVPRADGGTALTVVSGPRETEAIAIMARHGAESIVKQEGQEIGDISNAPRAGDDAPVVTEPVASLSMNRREQRTPEERSPFERDNLAQTTGQYYNMMRTRSDDGTVPPTVHREAITTPPSADRDRTVPGARTSSTGAPEVATTPPPAEVSRQPETSLQEFAARGGDDVSPEPDRTYVMQAKALVEDPVPSPAAAATNSQQSTSAASAETQQRSEQMSESSNHKSRLTDQTEPVFPPADASDEPTDSNPVPLSPTQPQRRTSDGAQEPQSGPTVFAVPAGNQAGAGTSGAGIGGIGVVANPDDPQKRISHEPPGRESANPEATALDREPISKPAGR